MQRVTWGHGPRRDKEGSGQKIYLLHVWVPASYHGTPVVFGDLTQDGTGWKGMRFDSIRQKHYRMDWDQVPP